MAYTMICVWYCPVLVMESLGAYWVSTTGQDGGDGWGGRGVIGGLRRRLLVG